MEFPQFRKNLTFKKLQLMAKVLSTLLSPYLVVDNLTLNKVKSKSWNELLNKFIARPTSSPPPKTMLPETLKLVTILQHQADSAYLIDITHHNLKNGQPDQLLLGRWQSVKN